MRIVSALFAILAFAAAAPQDTLDLHMRYGQPDLERFSIRPDVTLTAEYGSDGKACVLSVKPRHGLIAMDTALDTLSEVAPPDLRGKGQLDTAMMIASAQISVMLIHRGESEIKVTSLNDGTTQGVQSAEVKFKAADCDNQINSVSKSDASKEFHARYGKPDFERFIAGPDLALSVDYGMDGQACRMRIEHFHEAPGTGDDVAAALNEVVPPETRGKELGPGKVTGIAFPGKLPATEYENVTIDPYYGIVRTPPAPSGFEILFKRPACQSLPEHTEN